MEPFSQATWNWVRVLEASSEGVADPQDYETLGQAERRPSGPPWAQLGPTWLTALEQNWVSRLLLGMVVPQTDRVAGHTAASGSGWLTRSIFTSIKMKSRPRNLPNALVALVPVCLGILAAGDSVTLTLAVKALGGGLPGSPEPVQGRSRGHWAPC